MRYFDVAAPTSRGTLNCYCSCFRFAVGINILCRQWIANRLFSRNLLSIDCRNQAEHGLYRDQSTICLYSFRFSVSIFDYVGTHPDYGNGLLPIIYFAFDVMDSI